MTYDFLDGCRFSLQGVKKIPMGSDHLTSFSSFHPVVFGWRQEIFKTKPSWARTWRIVDSLTLNRGFQFQAIFINLGV
jgi:hypothetical protein